MNATDDNEQATITDVDELDEYVDQADQQRTHLVQQRRALIEVEDTLRRKAEDLSDEGALDEDEFDAVVAAIDDGEYGHARKILREAMVTLSWDDDEKQRLAELTKETLEDVEAEIEKFRNALLDVRSEWTTEDLVDYIHGKHPSMPKGSLRTALGTIDDLEDTGVDEKDMARFLSHQAPGNELTVEKAQQIVKYLKEVGDE